MRKTKTLKKPKKSVTKSLREHAPFDSVELKNKELVIETLLDCIKQQDLDTFQEVLIAHVQTVNKTNLAKKAKIGRQTLYDMLDPKKKFNPELETISSLIHALAA